MKEIIRKTTLAVCLTLGLGTTVAANDAEAAGQDLSERFGHRYQNVPLLFNLKGAGGMYQDTVPDIDGDGHEDPAMCFDVEVFDLKTGIKIGNGTDCLSNVTPNGDGVQLVGTTFFNTYFGNLVTRGVTTVKEGNPESLQGFSHITGSAPSGGSDVLSGTGWFSGATGSARLSGLVDMSQFAGGVGQPIEFDCLFVVKLDR